MQEQVNLSQKRNRTKDIFCISSRCEDDLHILFWDFDMVEKYFVLRSLSQIQNWHELSDIYIIKSNHGYNAFCLDKFFLNHAYNILFYSRWNDFNHIRIGYKSESWALRMGKDKKILMKLEPTANKEIEREQSKAHYEFFKKYFNYDKLIITKPDKCENIQLESYKQDVI